MQAVAAHTGKHSRLYGVVVTKEFDIARLVKYQQHGFSANGTFHPSKIAEVAYIVSMTHP